VAEYENQDEGQILDGSEVPPTAENTPEDGGEGSPPTQVEDWSSKAQALEERLARQEERARYLEETNRLLAQQAQMAQRQPAQPEPGLSSELQELDKTLDPLFNKRLRGQLEPLGQNIAGMMDGNDAMRFEMYLMRNHPDILDNEEGLNRVFQQVEQVRQQAANVYGKYLSRVDAFLYAQGLDSVKEKTKNRTQKKSVQVKEEAKRQLQVQAAKSGEGTPDARRPAGAAAVESILKRMRAGERVSSDDRAKVREHLANVEL